jgi:hypothetical protein
MRLAHHIQEERRLGAHGLAVVSRERSGSRTRAIIAGTSPLAGSEAPENPYETGALPMQRCRLTGALRRSDLAIAQLAGRRRQTGTALSLSEPGPLGERGGFQLAVTR